MARAAGTPSPYACAPSFAIPMATHASICHAHAMRHVILAFATAMALGSSAQARSPEPGDSATLDRLDAFVRGVVAGEQFSGVVLVAQDGAVVFERAYGLRDEKTEELVTPATRFDLASAGKMFTTTAVLQLIAAGKLSLDTTLGTVLPDYPNAAMRTVTVRQLLMHTAGAGETDALFYPDSLALRGREPSVAELVARSGTRAPAFPPGSKQDYSNHGMTLLGRMVEVLSGQSYRDYVAEHIFRPAGMDAAHADDPCRPNDPGQAVGYVAVGDERMPNCFLALDGGWPAGGQMFTARDLLRFATALRKGRLNVPAALFREATTPKLQGFGLGFFATDYGPGHLPRDLRWGHGGKLQGQCIDVRTYEATGETVVTLGNNDSPACYRIASFLHDDWKRRHPPG